MLRWLRYYWAQIRQAHAKRRKDTSFRALPFIDLIIANTSLPKGARILCLGPRNGIEIDAWHARGYWNVAGLDILPSLHEAIRWGDMHQMPYGDWSYDLVYASHVLEHSQDFRMVKREIVRILEPGGYLFAAFPVNFQITAHDRYDFRSAAGFLRHFDSRILCLWSYDAPAESSVLVRMNV